MRSDLPTVLRDPREGAPAVPQLRASSLAGSETQGGWAGASGWGLWDLWGPRGVCKGGSCTAHGPPAPGRGHRPCSTPPAGLGPGAEASAHAAPTMDRKPGACLGPRRQSSGAGLRTGSALLWGCWPVPPPRPTPRSPMLFPRALSSVPDQGGGPSGPHAAVQPSVCGGGLGRVEEALSWSRRTWAPKTCVLQARPRLCRPAWLCEAAVTGHLPSGVQPSRPLTRHKAGRAQGSLSGGPAQSPAAHQSPAEGPHIRAACACQLEPPVLPGGQGHGHLRSTAAHDNGLRTAIVTWDTCQALGP